MKIIKIILISIILTAQCLSQEITFESVDLKAAPLIEGTLLRPADKSAVPLLIIIQGSGPTDRNGNQSMMKNNSLKMLAEGLSENGIASFRYDKRIVPLIKNGTLDESKLSFDDFISDAKAVLDYFKASGAFSSYYIAGHSQGSLVGMMVGQRGIDGFISIAGAGQSIDEVVIDQLERQAPALADNAREAFAEMQANGKTENYSPGLASIFRPSVQPFMRSWMQYKPQEEIAKLTCPVLIINGDNDLQVGADEAALLAQAKPDARLEIIPKMNHILKPVEGGDMENAKSYNEPQRPLSPELLQIITDFIKK